MVSHQVVPLVRVFLKIVEKVLHADLAAAVAIAVALRGPHRILPFLRANRASYLALADLDKHFLGPIPIVARVAEALPGTKIKRLAFPDAPAPGAPEMLNYMRVDAAKIAAAAKKLVKG